jgi:hypothetical protein
MKSPDSGSEVPIRSSDTLCGGATEFPCFFCHASSSAQALAEAAEAEGGAGLAGAAGEAAEALAEAGGGLDADVEAGLHAAIGAAARTARRAAEASGGSFFTLQGHARTREGLPSRRERCRFVTVP